MNPPSSHDALLRYVEHAGARWGTDYESAINALTEALEFDPGFPLARLALIDAYQDVGEREQAAQELLAAEELRHEFTAFERIALDDSRARLSNRRLEALTHKRKLLRMAPHNPLVRFALAFETYRLNRPRETIEILEPVLPYESNLYNWWPVGVAWWAHHSLGKHERELEWANLGLEMFPDVGLFYYGKGAAFAAMGRLDALGQVIDECTSVQLSESNMNVGRVMTNVALELRAHGHRQESDKLATRAVEWYARRANGLDIKDRDLSDLMGHSYALRAAGRWEKARALLLERKERGDSPLWVAGALGMIAASTGDHDEAWRAFNELPDPGLPSSPAIRCLWRACIASYLGEKELAVEQLKEGYAKGLSNSWARHIDVDLEPLWDYPPFQELIEPKG